MLLKRIFITVFTLFCVNLSLAQESEVSLEITEMVLSMEVLEREPVNIVKTFKADDERGWVFARLVNSSKMTYIHFVWYHEETEYFQIRMRVGVSPSWRTYASVALQPGAWRVELQDNSRSVLKEIRFHVGN